MDEKKRKTILWKLFISTLYLSAFTFGGGYVIVTLMKNKFVDEYHWIEENEMLDLVSKVRLGVDLDIIDETKPELLNILLIASQKNYIQNLQQNENMTPQEIDKQRAHIIRKILQELAPDISKS